MLLCSSRMCCLEKAGSGRPPPPTWYQRYALPINKIMLKQNVGVKQISLNKGILHFLCFNGGVYSGQPAKLPQPSLKSFEILSSFCGLFRSHLIFIKVWQKGVFIAVFIVHIILWINMPTWNSWYYIFNQFRSSATNSCVDEVVLKNMNSFGNTTPFQLLCYSWSSIPNMLWI